MARAAKKKAQTKKKAAPAKKKTTARKAANKKASPAKKKPTQKKKATGKKKIAKKTSKKSVTKKKSATKKKTVNKKAASKKAPARKATSKKTKAAAKKAPAKKTAKKKVARTAATAKQAASNPKASDPTPTPKAKKTTSKRRKPAKNVAMAQAVEVKTEPASRTSVSRPRLVNLSDVKLPEGYTPSAKEEYMNPQQLLYFRNKLESWREELIEESQETLNHLRSEIRDVGDEAERASRESDNILELRTRDRYRKLLKKIDDAVKRVEDGSYGYCEETGEEIGIGRLEARPIATLTVDAQERREMLQRQFREDR